MEIQLRKYTFSMENISCAEDGRDFRNCSYSYGLRRSSPGKFHAELVLACNPIPGRFTYIIGHNSHGLCLVLSRTQFFTDIIIHGARHSPENF